MDIGRNIYLSLLLHLVGITGVLQSDIIADAGMKQPIHVSLCEETAVREQEGEKTLSPSFPVKKADRQPGRKKITPPQIEKKQDAPIRPPLQESGNLAQQMGAASPPALNLTGRSEEGSGTEGAATAVLSGTAGASHGSTVVSVIPVSGQQGSGIEGASDNYRQAIRTAIQSSLVYPYVARKKRMEGTVLIKFKINLTGVPEDIRIMRSSGYSMLDTAAKETVVKASPFPAAGKTIEIPIIFLLQDN